MRGKLLAFAVAAGMFLCGSSSRGDTLTAQLEMPDPAEIVTVTGGTLGADTLSAYAGLLNWTIKLYTPDGNAKLDSATVKSLTMQTYCVDIKTDISIGSTYGYTVNNDLASVSPTAGWPSNGVDQNDSSLTIISAIDSLWAAKYTTSLGSPDEAAAFQLAIWNIIYGVTANGVALNGTDALSQAYARDIAASQTAPLLSGNSPMALIGTDFTGIPRGQDQALVNGNNADGQFQPTTPLPSSFVAGFGLFGLVFIGRKLRLNSKQIA